MCKISLKTFFTHLLFIVATILLLALFWSLRQFPMQSTYTVFFVLSSNTAGHDAGLVESLFTTVFYPVIFGYLFLLLVYFVIKKIYKVKTKKTFCFFNNGKIYFSISIIYLVIVLISAVFTLKAWQYIKIFYDVNKRPVSSDFYKENYIDASSVKITFPENKRNIIVIFMESMEQTFSSINNGGALGVDLIPNINSLALQNINFSDTDLLGGGYNLEGTSWTSAGLLSKLSALPYFSPSKISKDGKIKYLANARTLTDVLFDNGYNCLFSFGSDKSFENRDAFLETHNVKIHDINWYKNNGYIPYDYQVFWGFEDEKLFSFAKLELDNLSKQNKPFFYGLLTVDTHFPDGFKCSSCPNIYDKQIMNVITCADKQIYDFISWAKEQAWYSNTTIVILGDHNFLNAPNNNFIKDESVVDSYNRRWLNVFINTGKTVSGSICKNRQFSSYDIFPTMLDSIGANIEGNSLYFGKSLFSGEKTLVEKYGESFVNKELMKRIDIYESLK